MLRCLKHLGITVKPSTCKLFCESIQFLGDPIDVEELHARSDKTDAILNAPKPQEHATFPIKTNTYYGKLIPNLAAILQNLNNLLRNDVKWE